MAFIKALLFVGALSSQTLALEAPISGFGVADLEWDIHVQPGAAPTNFTGTIEQVASQGKQLNPRWDETLANYSAQGDDASGLEARQGAPEVLCGGLGYNWAPASVGRIDRGIYHLSHVPGKPRSNPGPGLCGRVSCSYYSAIWWCNDKNAALELGSFRDMAIGAATIMNNCRFGLFQGGTMGQAFMPGDWNVIVRDDTSLRIDTNRLKRLV